jgi:hypothetical protein
MKSLMMEILFIKDNCSEADELGQINNKERGSERRVRGDTRMSASGNAAKDSVVKRVFYSYSFPSGNVDSDTERMNSDDYCCVMIESYP